MTTDTTTTTPEPEFADWDAFFAEQPEPERDGMPYRLLGKERRLPSSLGTVFVLQANRVQRSTDPGDVRSLLGYVVGPDTLDDMLDAGMTDEQFETVLLWATENVKRPGSLSMAAAAEEYRRREAVKAGQGKAAAPQRKRKRKKRSSGRR